MLFIEVIYFSVILLKRRVTNKFLKLFKMTQYSTEVYKQLFSWVRVLSEFHRITQR